jgi:hypothetical protein
MDLPVYILIRTSNRPKFFGRMMETIKEQTYKNIITIVHSDDPRDNYVTGDIILKCPAYGPEFGSGTYNLYCNRLLKAIPDRPGYFHFLDDDDEYAAPDIIERLVKLSKPDHVNVGRVRRWNNTTWPKRWGVQKSYQTECFFIHTDYKLKAHWWGHKGGDHHYSKQLTKLLPINWIDKLLICKAQEGKGYGRKLDKDGKKIKLNVKINDNEMVACLGLIKHIRGSRKEWIKQGEIKEMRYEFAKKLERLGKVKITYPGNIEKAPPRNLLFEV